MNRRTLLPSTFAAFYEPLDRVLGERFDGLVITGAPVETLPFEEVDYWSELVRLMDWSRENVWSTLHICWGAQAGLYRHFGVKKYPLSAKMFGLFRHTLLDPHEPIVRGFDEGFLAPHSRHTEVRKEDIKAVKGLKLLAVSDVAGVYMACSRDGRMLFVTGHPEYDRHTLKAEYDRDVARGMSIDVPANYFPGDDPRSEPAFTWRSTPISCTRTGSTITSTRPRRSTWLICRRPIRRSAGTEGRPASSAFSSTQRRAMIRSTSAWGRRSRNAAGPAMWPAR